MEENKNTEEEKKEEQKPLRGLYRYVRISVGTLNKIIIALCVLLVVCIFIAIENNGFRVSFDPNGGSDVETQVRMYEEKLDPVEDPSRDGYVFKGWYRDEGLSDPWDIDNDLVTESMTLYAGWEEE